jgi:hypothetical protein
MSIDGENLAAEIADLWARHDLKQEAARQTAKRTFVPVGDYIEGVKEGLLGRCECELTLSDGWTIDGANATRTLSIKSPSSSSDLTFGVPADGIITFKGTRYGPTEMQRLLQDLGSALKAKLSPPD